MILMAIQTFDIFTFVKPTYLNTKNTKKGYLGAFLTGILAGIFSSPCSTPILVVLLAIVGQSGSLFYGMLLLLLYSIGNSILVIVTGTSIGLVKKITKNYQKFMQFFYSETLYRKLVLCYTNIVKN